jgi:hypothetical protein
VVFADAERGSARHGTTIQLGPTRRGTAAARRGGPAKQANKA